MSSELIYVLDLEKRSSTDFFSDVLPTNFRLWELAVAVRHTSAIE